MAEVLSVEFDEGLALLENAINQLPAGLVFRVYGPACRAMARLVAKEAKATVRVKSGNLQGSIRVRTVTERYGSRRVPSARVVAGGPGAYHAHLIEFGTVRAPAYPFLRPAIDKNLQAQHQAFANAASRAYDKLTTQLATGNVSRSIVSAL